MLLNLPDCKLAARQIADALKTHCLSLWRASLVEFGGVSEFSRRKKRQKRKSGQTCLLLSTKAGCSQETKLYSLLWKRREVFAVCEGSARRSA